jgi:hypothetical protein
MMLWLETTKDSAQLPIKVKVGGSKVVEVRDRPAVCRVMLSSAAIRDAFN